MACGWSDAPRLVLVGSKFLFATKSVPKVTVAARPIEWTRKVGGWTLENHFKQVKLKLN